MTTMVPHARSLAGTSTVTLRPRYEGANIATWIGFKHVNYLVEEAVLAHLREAGLPAGELFERHAVGTDLVALHTRIGHALHLDDQVRAEVRGTHPTRDGLGLTVRLSVARPAGSVPATTSRVTVQFRPDHRAGWPAPAAPPPPAAVAPYLVDRCGVTGVATPPVPLPPGAPPPAPAAGGGRAAVPDGLLDPGNGLAWRWRVPYFYCHFTDRLQMSGLVRLLEESVDLFLADRGVSIRTLLDEQRWIPVVPRSSLRLLAEVPMESELWLVFTVTELFKNLTYTARLTGYRRDPDALVPVFAGEITHGYAHIDSRRDWRLVEFDPRLRRALRGGGDSR